MKNIANYISISRIIMAIVLLLPKTFSKTFYIIYIYCGLSDILDGFLARKYKITSKFGAKIDSVADMLFVGVLLLKILPVIEISIGIYIWIIIIVLIKVFNIILGYIYYKQLTLLHTIGNKITGLVLFVIPLMMNFIHIKILEILICSVATFSAIQEGHYIRIRKI
jgi:CDP-diacylglycerol--glycerol-3-phosphate 3-phosphatidyltransferase